MASRRSWMLSIALAGSLGAACSVHDRTASRRVLTIDQAERMLWPGKIQTAYQPPTEEQRRALRDLIEVLWRGVAPEAAGEVIELARRAGLAVELWTIDDRSSWVVREPGDPVRGAGIYIVRATPAPQGRSILVQAPHVYYDLQTQRVAAAMFWARDTPEMIRGLFTNSQHRYQQAPDVREKRAFNPADVAHNVEHPFQTATAAVVAAGPIVVIQLHGFDGDADDDSVAIVSSGRREGSTGESSGVAAALSDVLGVTVARYPEDTRALGGTANVQGRMIATSAQARFIHIELALPLREQLREQALAARMARAIVDALAGERSR